MDLLILKNKIFTKSPVRHSHHPTSARDGATPATEAPPLPPPPQSCAAQRSHRRGAAAPQPRAERQPAWPRLGAAMGSVGSGVDESVKLLVGWGDKFSIV